MENDLNGTAPLQPEWNSPILGLFLCSVILVTVFGNILVILAVFKERSLKSVANYYIISLAFADLCVGLFVMPISALNKVTNNYWFFGDVLYFNPSDLQIEINFQIIFEMTNFLFGIKRIPSSLIDLLPFYLKQMIQKSTFFVPGVRPGLSSRIYLKTKKKGKDTNVEMGNENF
ncbi:dopamine receptor 2 [Brachionus plicatilis]|uniref:Dopamine receptor 2 n=1 Tax=Brachionus plicatilis TaxID=10195 RepID=A0A3M7PWJ2_BRAPC|nr:dopamine receptor 2 [Brachionus plicatilis]